MEKSKEKTITTGRDDRNDRAFTEGEPQGLDLRRDYAQRHRKLEWRLNWFELHRSKSDRELYHTMLDALTVKENLIKWQRETADTMAGYGPAGAGTPWISIGPRNVNGRVKSLAVDPTNADIIYAGAASGGVWKSIDAGESWRPLWDAQESLAIGSLAVAPSAPNTIYVGTGEWTPGWGPSYPGAGVYVSTDGGNNWTRHASVVARRIAKVVVSQADPLTVYVAGNSGFERSIDGGVSWTIIHAGQISDAVIDPNDAQTIYINVTNDRIYKTTDGGGMWTPLNTGPTGASASWIKLAIGRSGTHGSQFLLARSGGTIWKSIDGGSNWSTLAGSHATGYVGWCDMIAVAPDNEDIFMVGGVGVERTADGGGMWSSIGGLHSDQHQAVFAPSNANIVYECNDGGVYRSTDKGATFKKVSDGLVVTQFYDIGSWSHISTVVGGGAQDNGTSMTTGGLTWTQINGWDGGYFVIHPTDPRTIYSEHQNTDLFKTVDGGASWTNIVAGLSGGTPWVGVIAMDMNNPNRLYVGTSRVFRTTDGCATPWVPSSQVLAGSVSSLAVSLNDSNRVYAAAGSHIYRSDDAGVTNPWADKTAAPLPGRSITDIAIDDADKNRVAITFGGTSGGTPHSVFLSTTGGNGWSDISGNLPDISVNAVVFDPNNTNTIYVGTDVGVYRTIDLGVSWQAFDNGIPNVIITDLHVDPDDNMLYAATMGRGMYKLDITPGITEPEVDLYLRDSLLDTGERFPSPSGEPNPNDPADNVYRWESPDIKVDVIPYDTPAPVFDGVEFDAQVPHEDPVRGQVNRFYLQVHNRGWRDTANVHVRAFFADASAGLPALPNALTAPAFNLSSTVNWTPIGPAQTIPLLEPNRPVIVQWDWSVPMGAATHSCLMAVVSSGDDPITTTETNVNVLIGAEKRVCLKNLHVINAPGPRPEQMMVTLNFHNALSKDDLIDIICDPLGFTGGTVGILLETVEFVDPQEALHGVGLYAVREGEDIGSWYNHPRTPPKERQSLDELWKVVDRSRIFEFDPIKSSEIKGIKMKPHQKLRAVITCKGSKNAAYGATQKFAIRQRQGGVIVGGSTFDLRLTRARGLHPVSHIRVILERVRILDDHEPWWKGDGDFVFQTAVEFNNEKCRRHTRRLPARGHIEIGDEPGENERRLEHCIFDGYVAEKDAMRLSIIPVEKDTFDADDLLARYTRRFQGAPESWVGRYGPDDEPNDPERRKDWLVWYRIESLPL
jgi:hypothetical protein